ncbi:MAG: cadmium-translocating P-type ATPase [Bacilli bacterium]|nr:cadmium-translocating P-type ATPase [Bacilli bacterium]
MVKKIIMKNLICSGCAGKIEKSLSNLDYINSASFNFPNQVMLIDVTDDYNEDTAIVEIKAIVDSIEENVETYSYDKRHIIETKKQVEKYYSVFIGIGIFLIGYIFDYYQIPLGFIPLYWIGYLFIAYKIMKKTYKGIKRKEIFNENLLMFIATVAAMFLQDYFEAALVIIFYSLGEYLQHKAVHRSKQEVSDLMDLKIEYANKFIDGKIVIVDPLAIKKGDVLIIKNGEKIPVDGIILKGSTSLNTSALTGEAKLTHVKTGDYVLSGNLNVGSTLELQATKEYNESTIAKIIDLIENSTNHKARTENFITKFARYYTPFVTIAALLMFLIPTILDPNPAHTSDYIYRAATFLVISCPCALVLSIPLSYFSGIGAAARQGILFKGSTYLHMITNVDSIGIDKTGTLTHGNFTVAEFTDLETLKIAASAERYSNHPIAQSIVKFYEGELYDYENVEEVAGYGLIIKSESGTTLVGNRKLLNKHNVKVVDKKSMIGSNVFISQNGTYIGKVIVRDQIKDSSMNVIRRLSRKYNITMLTGDNELIAKDVADSLGGIHFECNLLPEEKIEKFNKIETKKLKMYVGDGINDAPLLRNADIGVAMGNGSEVAIDVADVIIMNDDLSLLEKALKIARKTKIIVFENIILSLGVKFSFLILAAFGLSTMLMAIFADVGITLIAVLNSLRIIYSRGLKS